MLIYFFSAALTTRTLGALMGRASICDADSAQRLPIVRIFCDLIKLPSPSDEDPLVIEGRRLSIGMVQSTSSEQIGGPLLLLAELDC